MYPTYILEWFYEEEGYEIGWRANTPERLKALRAHGWVLAQYGGKYRLVNLLDRSILFDYPEYPIAVKTPPIMTETLQKRSHPMAEPTKDSFAKQATKTFALNTIGAVGLVVGLVAASNVITKFSKKTDTPPSDS